MVPYGANEKGGEQKRGRTKQGQPVIQEVQQPDGGDVEMQDKAHMGATGHEAAGKLTGPRVAPRQPQ